MKKLLFLFSLLLVLAGSVSAQNKIIANISNFENNKGLGRACLFNSEASFEKSNPLQCVQVAVINNKATAVFENVPDGQYAIFVFHDANNNGNMDKNWLGIPKEGYGASQNKLPFAAAPKFEANKFSVSNKTTLALSIRLRNL